MAEGDPGEKGSRVDSGRAERWEGKGKSPLGDRLRQCSARNEGQSNLEGMLLETRAVCWARVQRVGERNREAVAGS